MRFDISARCACVVAFNPYCVRAVNKNIKEVDYWRRLLICNIGFGIEATIITHKQCFISVYWTQFRIAFGLLRH